MRVARGHRRQVGLAPVLGIAPNTLSQIESGKLPPSAAVLVKLAEETGCDLNWLLRGQATPKKETPPTESQEESRPAVLRFIAKREHLEEDETLWEQDIPFLGSYSPESGVIPPEEDIDEGEEVFVAAGPAPEGSGAIRLVAAVEGFSVGSYIVLSARIKPVAAGFGLLEIRGTPPEILTSWSRRRKRFEIFGGSIGAGTLPAASVTGARLFLRQI